jgi:hypothetical protein
MSLVGTLLRVGGALAALTVVTSASVAVASVAQSPASYRAQLNAMCRSATVEVHKLKAEMTRAQQAHDSTTVALDLGKLIGVGLREDAIIEQTPVPASLKANMTPAIRILEAADVVVHKALAEFTSGNPTGGLAMLKRAAKVGAPVNRYLDAAGLRDCGSNQG